MISRFGAHARSAGVFSDFDGTLATIVDDPSSARPILGAADALGDLARRYARVGVISGRPGAFLAEHLGGRGLALTGLYGLESVTPEGVRPLPEARPWRRVVAEVAALAEAELPPALGIERKGLTMAVHFRVSPGYADLAERWTAETAARTGLAVHPARMSFELRPPLPHDKGLVLAEAAEGLTHVMFVGDDRGDLEAFDTLDRMARRRRHRGPGGGAQPGIAGRAARSGRHGGRRSRGRPPPSPRPPRGARWRAAGRR